MNELVMKVWGKPLAILPVLYIYIYVYWTNYRIAINCSKILVSTQTIIQNDDDQYSHY
jgi:hypothetical protein